MVYRRVMKLVFYSYPKTHSDIRSNIWCDTKKFLFHGINIDWIYFESEVVRKIIWCGSLHHRSLKLNFRPCHCSCAACKSKQCLSLSLSLCLTSPAHLDLLSSVWYTAMSSSSSRSILQVDSITSQAAKHKHPNITIRYTPTTGTY